MTAVTMILVRTKFRRNAEIFAKVKVLVVSNALLGTAEALKRIPNNVHASQCKPFLVCWSNSEMSLLQIKWSQTNSKQPHNLHSMRLCILNILT